MKKILGKSTKETILDKAVKSVKTSATSKERKVDYNWGTTISTGSTLLDLAISGGKCHTGGIPLGIILEIFGKSSAGKSSILSEIAGSVQALGGHVSFKDPEARLDSDYCQVYGLNLDTVEYSKPDTVTEVFNDIYGWKPNSKEINCLCVDSLAALSTDLELEKGDKMGMRRAKEFSEGFRKTCRIIEKNNWVLACSNQVRQGDYGEVTPGGKAAGFYASLRIKVAPMGVVELEKTMSSKKKVKKTIGVKSKCSVIKSTINDPFRTAEIYIIFGYGIDDIRGNLQYRKDMLKETTYDCFGKTYQAMNAAINYIEKNNLQNKLKEETIKLWNEVEALFKINRRVKKR